MARKTKPPTTYKLLGSGAATLSGIAVRKLTDAAWYAARGTTPPKNPAAPGVSWPDALAWATFSGLAVAGGRLLAARGAAAAYTSLTGKLPPGVDEVG